MSLESYHFSDDIYSDLVEKTREICNLLKLDDNHETILLDNIKQFHFETRDNMDIIRYFIKRREVKLFQMLFEKNIQMPLRDHIGCQDSDKVWRYLHLAYLLYENAHENPQPEVQVALINKLEESMKESNTEVENKTDKIPDPSLLMSSLMGSLMNRGSNEGGPDLGKLINGEGDLGKLMGSLMGGMGGGEGPDLGKLMGSLMGGMGGGSNLMEDPDILTKGMDPIMEHLGLKDTSSNLSNPAMVTDIMSEIKDNLKNSGKNVNQLIEKTMEMGQKYQDKIKSGELSMEEMMGSLMGVLKNPETLMETMKDMDLSNLPDPTTMISSLMGSGLNMGGDLNIDSILSQVMGSNKSSKEQDKDTTPLTNEQLKELEEFYSNLNLK